MIGKYTGINKAGISKGLYQRVEQIAKNPEVLDNVILKAKEKKEIPIRCL